MVGIINACECVCREGLNESQCSHMGHHKQTMKNESGEAVQLVFLWEQLQAGIRTFGDNRLVFLCVCVSVHISMWIIFCFSVRVKCVCVGG